MLARLWNGICKINDSVAIAEFGWAGILLFMYFVTNSIVGIFATIPSAMYWVFGVSLVAVFAFTVKPSELKSRGAELGMLPLNIMSALGDIISYVRLFAVGLASVKVAENFNSMATGLVSGVEDWYVEALMSVLMVAILVVGHALNLAMAGLSILVHAVRLNTLEFSNHKGVSWSGYAFNPFKKH
jgi:V/A-type H+-transporting ATPase subunit I